VSYRSFLSDLQALLRANGLRARSGRSLPVAGPSTDQQRDPVVGRVQAFVDEHLAADLSLDRMAAVANRSPSTLARRFREEADTTPWRYVMERRVAAAKRLLATTDRSLASIAVDTGFYDQAHLTRTFKRLHGQTPGEYRDEGAPEADDDSAPTQST
jgi:AraC family transcriptional regulator